VTAATSFPKHEISVLLLENIHATAHEIFQGETFCIETVAGALSEDELVERIRGVHVLGIRSKTRVTARVLAEGKRLLSVGAFCIGTNQIDLAAANGCGIPVFNAPFSNTRSVAEMILAEIVMLARNLGDRNREVHAGLWRKSSEGLHEVRGKTVGIVGYGHIGTQVGVLAEALGMRVLTQDIRATMAIGNSRPCATLQELLAEADFVTLHVPETPQTMNLIGRDELTQMKRGSYLLNASRGTVVDVDALADAIRGGHLAGAAIDVFPLEPESNKDPFDSPLRNLPNVILTPHVGGSTSEAQAAIGREVATALTRFVNQGVTAGAVNFPQVDTPPIPHTHRILNVHRNVPGVLRDINRIVSELGANIHAQVLGTDKDIGYLVMDLDQDVSREVTRQVAALETNVRTRILY
jgi:D-3-phosphoglycerate dehydrogenase